MKHLDLFSGIGGFALAAQWMGWQTVGFCEKEKYAKRVLGRHWPNVPIIDDIRDIKEPIGCDIITGGFPCQPFSTAGKQTGTQDDRYLWPSMLKVVALERPAWVVAENVAGIIGLALDQVLADLESAGYSSRALVIPACAVDAPHRRDRVWIVAHFINEQESLANSGRKLQRGETKPERPPNHIARCSSRVNPGGSASSTTNMANSNSTRREKQRGTIATKAEHKTTECGGQWSLEPPVGRVAHGVSNRVDRLRGLGNAIVPQVAYQLFKFINKQNDHCNIR